MYSHLFIQAMMYVFYSTNLLNIPLQLDVAELETVLVKDQATFPDNPSVWLLDLASLLNLRMEKVPENEPLLLDDKPAGKVIKYIVCSPKLAPKCVI